MICIIVSCTDQDDDHEKTTCDVTNVPTLNDNPKTGIL